MMWDVAPSLLKLEEAIQDPTNPIGMRMRAAYFLKQAYTDENRDENNNNNNNSSSSSSSDKHPSSSSSCREIVIRSLSEGLADKRHGSLMRHEYAYVMGQLQDERCCQVLETILLRDDDCSMVRHEAAEALAAIGASNSRSVLKETMEKTKTNLPEIYETCLLALNVMDWRDRGGPDGEGEEAYSPVGCACMLKKFSSIDPAPAHPAHVGKSDEELGDILCDTQLSMFDRYRAMFSLRDRGGEAAVLQLCRALSSDSSSALLRHEVSYVLGQLQHPASVPALEENLRKKEEHQMVRHESAEALGAIEGAWDKVEAILTEFARDENQVVRESCLVALDAANYWGHNNSSATGDENDDNSEGEEKKEALSFVQQKNLNEEDPTAKSGDRSAAQHVLNNHFNTQG